MKDSTRQILDTLFSRYPLSCCEREVLGAFTLLHGCFTSGGKLLVCGNGGSAADSEHIVGELMKGFLLPRPLTAAQSRRFEEALGSESAYLVGHLQQGLPAISLVSQSGLVTAYGNDVAPDMAFAQQVFSYARPGDLLLGITTSGASVNVLHALRTAKAVGIPSILLMGSRNRQNAALADVAVCVGESETFKVQELHLPIYHALCAAVEEELFGNS